MYWHIADKCINDFLNDVTANCWQQNIGSMTLYMKHIDYYCRKCDLTSAHQA